MNSKLTLRMDDHLITVAKDYAAAHGSSVSQMVANYFAALAQKADASTQKFSANDAAPVAGPVTRSLVGILKAKPGQPQVSEDDYHAYLEHKYLHSDGALKPAVSP
jgi:hypothetical protein